VSERLLMDLRDPWVRKMLNSLLLETEIVYRRKPRELIYVRRKPIRRGSPVSMLHFTRAAYQSYGMKMKKGDELPPAAKLVKEKLSGAKLVEKPPPPQQEAFNRDIQRLRAIARGSPSLEQFLKQVLG